MKNEVEVVDAARLFDLIQQKLVKAGLPNTQANEVSKHLVFADACGIHSHGAVRVEYYAERISKGGVTLTPQLALEQTGPATGIFHGDNGIGQYVCDEALKEAIKLAHDTGLSLVGVSKMSHSGALSYYVKKAAEQDLIGIAMCQSDPMVVPFGGSDNYFGTNPIAFSAPRKEAPPVVFDMATSVQAWGKILDARSKNEQIPSHWAVDDQGKATTDPYEVKGLLPIAGPKGYGLMMMVDVLAGTLLGLPFGKQVSSMYTDLTEKRNLGQVFLMIDPKRFTDLDDFKEKIDQMVEELHQTSPAPGVEKVLYPGELAQITYEKYMQQGIPIATSIYQYLISPDVHYDQFSGKDSFAK
ncbi:ureidoglycolate dehydrogenase [Enterococcus florum]|uniref:Ureidoglycolate dehydrogenase n=1 Tax=Enterococcus florum TaxID=2480627 RepID=A0A4P5PFS5_9ENTE|nr:ureidoglycolate dehydrogenase [Enterococcus florum]GCF95271.1 ureidoglycolate dehydrogenase [Enterococcus florum]